MVKLPYLRWLDETAPGSIQVRIKGTDIRIEYKLLHHLNYQDPISLGVYVVKSWHDLTLGMT